MIPHQPPILFEVQGGEVVLSELHPLCRDGRFLTVELIELAAQLAGANLAGDHAGGMLVEVESATLHRREVHVGERVSYEVSLVRTMGPLHRFRVVLTGVLEVALTLRVA